MSTVVIMPSVVEVCMLRDEPRDYTRKICPTIHSTLREIIKFLDKSNTSHIIIEGGLGFESTVIESDLRKVYENVQIECVKFNRKMLIKANGGIEYDPKDDYQIIQLMLKSIIDGKKQVE